MNFIDKVDAIHAFKIPRANAESEAADKQLDFRMINPDTYRTLANKPLKKDRICKICNTTETPEWRRGPDGTTSLCNACGLAYKKSLRGLPSRKKKVAKAIEAIWCRRCNTENSLSWHYSPLGPNTLCKECKDLAPLKVKMDIRALLN